MASEFSAREGSLFVVIGLFSVFSASVEAVIVVFCDFRSELEVPVDFIAVVSWPVPPFDVKVQVFADSVVLSIFILVDNSFLDLVVLVEVDSPIGLLVPFSVTIGTFSNELEEVGSIFEDSVTFEIVGTGVLLSVSFPEDVVILPDTDAVVSNVVV